MSAQNDEPNDIVERCLACGRPLRLGQLYYPDVSGDYLHAKCIGPERESFVKDIETGEPLGPDDPIPGPLTWGVDP